MVQRMRESGVASRAEEIPLKPDATNIDRRGLREVAVVDRARVYAERIQGRRVVYLDTNVWIALAHESTEDARRCLRSCKAALHQQRAIFPVSHAAISELIEQGAGPSQTKRGELMDELSCGITFRSLYAVREVEARNALGVLLGSAAEPNERSRVFSYVVEAFGDATVSFPPEWTEDMVARFIAYYWASGAVTTIKWYLDHVDLDAWRDQRLNSERASQASFEASLRAAIDRHKTRAGKPHYASALREEHHYFFRNWILPAVVAMADKEQVNRAAQRIRRIIDGDDHLLAQVMKAVPSLCAECCLLAHRIMNPGRPYKPEDFWDIEHSSMPSAYSDGFCTLDRGLRHGLYRSGALDPNQCTILESISELEAFADTA